MRKHLPLLLILLAVGLGYWLLAGTPEDGDPVEWEGDAGMDPGEDDAADGRGDPTELDVSKRARTKARPKRVFQPADPRTLPKGVLLVVPVGPDLKPLMNEGLHILVTPRGQRATKQGVYDVATGARRFERVIAGPVDVKVTGDHIICRTTQAVVKRDAETTFELHLEMAGAVKYDVTTYAKTRPKRVLLELFDFDGQPADAWFQERTSRAMTQPRKSKSLTLGPEGVVFGIRPGRYRMKVTNIESEEWDDAEITVEGGKTVPLTLTVRR
jgi:hypothetical protein